MVTSLTFDTPYIDPSITGVLITSNYAGTRVMYFRNRDGKYDTEGVKIVSQKGIIAEGHSVLLEYNPRLPDNSFSKKRAMFGVPAVTNLMVSLF